MVFLINLILAASLSHADSSVTVGLGGLTLHGYVEPLVAQFMPNKIDSGGYLVRHDEFSFLRKKDGLQYGFNILKDCAVQPANMIYAGSYYKSKTFKNTTFGWMAGLYTRKAFRGIISQKTTVIGNQVITETTSADMGRLPLQLEAHGWQYIPIAMFTVSHKFILTNKSSIEINAGTSIILSHATIGYRYDF